MKNKKDLLTLHRYFIWADTMKNHYDRSLMDGKSGHVEQFMYMSLWYGTTYVLVEGWEQFELSDEKIDVLLESEYTDLLRRYRNGVFHFQEKYFDERFTNFMKADGNITLWIRNLMDEFSRYFLEYFKARQTTGLISNEK